MATVSPTPQPPDYTNGFSQEIRELVAETAPRLFAVVEEFVTDSGAPDARVAAWGTAYQGRECAGHVGGRRDASVAALAGAGGALDLAPARMRRKSRMGRVAGASRR